MNVLFVDADKELLESYGGWLCWSTLFHCTPANAYDNASALTMLRLRRFDLLITEVSGGGVNGLALLEEVCRDKLAACVVFLAKRGSFSVAQKAMRCRLFDYLTKPVSEKEMQGVILRAAEHCGFATDEPSGNALARNAVIHGLLHGKPESVDLFRMEIQKEKDGAGFYANVISAIYQNLPWLANFLEMSSLRPAREDRELCVRNIEALFCLLRLLLPEPDDCTIYKINNYVLNRIDGKIDSRSIAEAFFFNYYYLSSMYKAKTGVNLQKYITTARMMRACFLIRNTRRRIYDIGGELGFQGGEHFSGRFRKVFGFSPSALRARDAAEGPILPLAAAARGAPPPLSLSSRRKA
ncbi:MAG: DNA-binding response regulator [Clostridiales Family XIII bacterium]|jgi:two-component system response regulator YesN|nr:DNA-binding response regulator [Clostridiales Family XIII bacterium]